MKKNILNKMEKKNFTKSNNKKNTTSNGKTTYNGNQNMGDKGGKKFYKHQNKQISQYNKQTRFYKGDNGLVANLLEEYYNIPLDMNNLWRITDKIVDVEKGINLVNVHYDDETFDPNNSDHDIIRPVRGVIFDLINKVQVAGSQGYIGVITTNHPIKEITEENGDKYVVVNETIYNNAKIYMGYESFFVRVFKHKGIIYFSTQKKIDASKSRWGNNKLFREVFEELCPIKLEELFSEKEGETSPYNHYFIVQDPCVAVVSSINERRVIYVGTFKIGKGNMEPVDVKSLIELHKKDEPDIFTDETNIKPMINSRTITDEIANKFLYPHLYAKRWPEKDAKKIHPNEMVLEYKDEEIIDVYFNPSEAVLTKLDERLYGGDFVAISFPGKDGKNRFYRVESESYQYRKKVTTNDSEPYHRYFNMLIDIYREFENLENHPCFGYDKSSRQMYLVSTWDDIYYYCVSPVLKNFVKISENANDKVNTRSRNLCLLDQFYYDLENTSNFILDKFMDVYKELKENNYMKEDIYETMNNLYKEHMAMKNKDIDIYQTLYCNLLFRESRAIIYRLVSNVKKYIKFEYYTPKQKQVI